MINATFVQAVHDKILIETKVGCKGVDIQKLESMLARVENQLYYNKEIDPEDLFLVAAWYGVAIAKGHAFVDANKRTALAVMLVLLETQGISIQANNTLDDLMVDIVESDLPHDELVQDVALFLYASWSNKI